MNGESSAIYRAASESHVSLYVTERTSNAPPNILNVSHVPISVLSIVTYYTLSNLVPSPTNAQFAHPFTFKYRHSLLPSPSPKH